jgi:hypothetical protein
VLGCKRPEAAAARGRRLAVSHWLRAAELEEYQIVAQRLFRLKMFKKNWNGSILFVFNNYCSIID